MKTYLPITILLIFIFSCSSNNFESDRKAIKEAMDKQTECWNKGDLTGFMEGYWKSDSLRFLGKRGLTKGWQATLDNYNKSYPDAQTMGKLIFNYVSFEPLTDEQMFVVGKWTLEREKDTLRGYYSLLWKKIDGEWKVVFDHSS